MASEATAVLIADDHPMFRDALRLAVGRAVPDACIFEAGQLGEAIEIARFEARLDLILLDLRMPGAEGFSGVALLHAERPATPILIVSSVGGADVAYRARAYGAIGFLPKTARLESIEAAIVRALAGEHEQIDLVDTLVDPVVDDMARRIAALTPAELRVLVGIFAGRLNKQIAHDLGIAEATVKAHMTAIMRKMNVRNRTQAALAARALDIDFAG